MNKIIIFCLLLFAYSAKAQYWAWATRPNSLGSGEEGYSISADPLGNVYFGGFFSGTITVGSSTLVNPGGASAFLIKYDSNGNITWGQAATSSVDCYGLAVSSDNSGNAFLAGYFDSPTIQLGATTLSLTSTGGEDSFVAKYDQNGNLLWAQGSYGSGGVEGSSLSTDALGNTYFTGRFLGNFLSFGTSTVTGSPSNFQAFTAKFDPAGNVIWLKQGSSSSGGSTNGTCITAEKLGGCFITGNLTGTVNFGTNTLVASGPGDAFITKYDVNGNELWAKSIPNSSGSIVPKGICTDALGNFYLNGKFTGTSIIGSNTLTSVTNEMFLAKFDGNGNPLWAKQSTSWNGVTGYAVSSNSIGIYAVAAFNYSFTFGTVSHTASASATDPAVVFIMDFNGNIICSDILDSGGDDTFAASADPNSNAVYVGGDFIPNTFVLGTNTLVLSPFPAYENAFAAKFQCSPTGIKETSLNQEVKVSPNPFLDKITVVVENEKQTVQIFNSFGSLIYTSIVESGKTEIDLQKEYCGIYFLKIGTVTMKIIKE